MISEWIDFFIPNDLPDPTGVEVKRARTGLMITFAAIFWALIAALLGLATESYAAVAGLMIAMVLVGFAPFVLRATGNLDRKSTRLNSSHVRISYAVFCL